MTTAFVKIHNFINSLKDDEVIRATKQDLSKSELDKEKNENFKNDNGVTHLYVRSGFFSKLRQVLTSRTDGAIEKQKIAKDLIIDALNSLPKELKNDNSVKNAFENIKQTLTSNDVKDFTAKMIREDLTTIYNALNLINRTVEINSAATKNNASATPVAASPTTVAVSPTVVTASPTVEEYVSPNKSEESLKTNTNNEEISNGGDEPLEFESYFSIFGVGSGDNSEKKIEPNLATKETNNKTEEPSDSALRNEEIPDGDDALSEVGSGSDSDDEDGALSSSESELPLNETSSDPAVHGIPVEEPSSKLAESAPTINTTSAPIGKAIERDTDAAEAATERTPSPATSAPSSTAETKSTANANPYLASIKSVWNLSSSGRYEITTLFSISGDVNPSNIIAQAYIHPSGKKLNFSGDAKKSVGIASSYITVEADVPKSNFFIGTGPITNSRTENRLSQFREALFKTYIDSFNKINAEYKQSNPGKKLETLVIVPIISTDGTLSETHVAALVSAVRFIQFENETLKIAISADKDTHAARIRVAYEENMQ